MPKANRLRDPRLISEEWLQPLPYRPTCKLTRTDEPSCHIDGWRLARFRDERGNLYERERDGEWERWSIVVEQKNARGRLLYTADTTKREPDDHGDCLDRIDDLKFCAMATLNLIDDAADRGLFDVKDLKRLRAAAKELLDEASCLTPQIAEKPKNGHA